MKTGKKKSALNILIFEAAMPFFECFSGGFEQVWVNDIYRLKHKHAFCWWWELFLRRNFADTETFASKFTSWIRDFLGQDNGEYIDKNNHFKRLEWEKECVDAPLEDVADGEQIVLHLQYNKKGKLQYWDKDWSHPQKDGKCHIIYNIIYDVRKGLAKWENKNKEEEHYEEEDI